MIQLSVSSLTMVKYFSTRLAYCVNLQFFNNLTHVKLSDIYASKLISLNAKFWPDAKFWLNHGQTLVNRTNPGPSLLV